MPGMETCTGRSPGQRTGPAQRGACSLLAQHLLWKIYSKTRDMVLYGDMVKAVVRRWLWDCLDLHDWRTNVFLPNETSNYGLPSIPTILQVVYLHYQNLFKPIKA